MDEVKKTHKNIIFGVGDILSAMFVGVSEQTVSHPQQATADRCDKLNNTPQPSSLWKVMGGQNRQN